MTQHSDIRSCLYEYAMDSLNDDVRRRVEQHLSSCHACTHDLKELQDAIALLSQAAAEPSEEKDEAFWHSLSNNIEREIRLRTQTRPSLFDVYFEKVKRFFTFRPAYAYTLSGSLAMMIIAVILFQVQPLKQASVVSTLPADDSAMRLALFKNNQERVSQYFQNSRTLLVGLANMQTEDAAHVDLSAEKTKARTLIREARFVKAQPINNRTERLVNDLERILIELANLEESKDLPNVELIRSGIHQENLLFKIRMAEASFDTSRRVGKETIY